MLKFGTLRLELAARFNLLGCIAMQALKEGCPNPTGGGKCPLGCPTSKTVHSMFEVLLITLKLRLGLTDIFSAVLVSLSLIITYIAVWIPPLVSQQSSPGNQSCCQVWNVLIKRYKHTFQHL